MTMPWRFLERLNGLLVRDRGDLAAMSAQELESTYTEGCAAALLLEVEALRLKRRMTAAELDLGRNGDEAASAWRVLACRRREVSAELAELRERLAELRKVLRGVPRAERTRRQTPRFRRRG